jgi:hypothetical protein
MSNARHRHAGVPGVQAAELQHDQEQEEDDRAAGIREVLPFLPKAHGAQGEQVIADCGFETNGQSVRVESSNQSSIRNPQSAL